MLRVPRIDFKRPSSKQNFDVLGDWIEAITLFGQDKITRNEVAEILSEDERFPKRPREAALEIANGAWTEIEDRKEQGRIPERLAISIDEINDSTIWVESPIRSFLLVLSLFKAYPDWAKDISNSVEQGYLFEDLVEALCPALLPGWQVRRFGWPPRNGISFSSNLIALRNFLNTGTLQINTNDSIPPHAKDAGLDIVCCRNFSDSKEAFPVILLQCASGKNWSEKIHTPSSALWKQLLNLAVEPSTGIVVPFIIDEDKMRQTSLEGQTVIFDRLRILSSVAEMKFELPNKLAKRLVQWMEPKIENLPR